MFFRIRVKDNIVNIFNVYSPNKEKEQLDFLRSILQIVDKHNVKSIDNCIFACDWNNVLNKKLDKCGGLNINKKKYNESFNTFIEH